MRETIAPAAHGFGNKGDKKEREVAKQRGAREIIVLLGIMKKDCEKENDIICDNDGDKCDGQDIMTAIYISTF